MVLYPCNGSLKDSANGPKCRKYDHPCPPIRSWYKLQKPRPKNGSTSKPNTNHKPKKK